MKILVCSTRDLMGCLILNHLLPHLQGHQVDLVVADKTRSVDSVVPELAAMKFLERTLLNGLIFPLIDGQPTDPTATRLTFSGLRRRYAEQCWVVRDDESWAGGEGIIAASRPDLVISCRFGFIFKRAAIEAVGGHLFNVHPGALPAFAGQLPVMWAVHSGESRIGCSVHYITPGVDKGPVVATRWIAVERGRSHFHHRFLAFAAGLDYLIETVPVLASSGQWPSAEPQDFSQRRYWGWPSSQTFAKCRELGLENMLWDEYLQVLASFAPKLALTDFLEATVLANQESGI